MNLHEFEVITIGGGPAGLSDACSWQVFTHGAGMRCKYPRNDASLAMHGYLSSG